MSTSVINLPLYQTLVGLNVPEDEAGKAADISDLVRKDEILRLATKDRHGCRVRQGGATIAP